MKTAVVFYSLDGNCAFVAKQIKNQLNADIIQLQTKDEKKRKGFGKMLWGCCMVLAKKKPPLKPHGFDPSAYDLIVLGMPVWASTPAPPVRTFLSETAISGKKIALFVCHAGGKGTSLDKFKALLAGNDIIAEMDFNNPAAGDIEKSQQQIIEWAKKLESL